MINSKQYDLEERTLLFSKKVINLCKRIHVDVINKPLINQIIRSSTSIGANYREANETDMKKDFSNKIRIAKKEAKETQYWLELIQYTDLNNEKHINSLLQECQELIKILAAIYSKTK